MMLFKQNMWVGRETNQIRLKFTAFLNFLTCHFDSSHDSHDLLLWERDVIDALQIVKVN